MTIDMRQMMSSGVRWSYCWSHRIIFISFCVKLAYYTPYRDVVFNRRKISRQSFPTMWLNAQLQSGQSFVVDPFDSVKCMHALPVFQQAFCNNNGCLRVEAIDSIVLPTVTLASHTSFVVQNHWWLQHMVFDRWWRSRPETNSLPS
jgi:hypothetical protein